METKSSSPQKHNVKSRSKSTEEIQQAKKAFHTPQKSLPNTGEDVDVQDDATGDATDETCLKDQKCENQSQH
ncbi:hypothetical protein GDO86_005522 [Hymenochirus boettgeri]|uniref:Uncharacterized protein n=1 Tax=Hymenochirus boettgeri TaxID=247094 RepID=A0A8T2J6Q9_9PIPI|nr:hypothetical protein GDO86_005522 [Hymenochirus boettgeri]